MRSQARLIYEFFEDGPSLLVVLDACRFDTFTEIAGPATPVTSAGSCTPEWVKATFTGPLDAVYVTGNAWPIRIFRENHPFRSLVDLTARFWDEKFETVHPRWVNLVAAKYLMRRENLIVHYVQPHAPVIGEWFFRHPELRLTARELYARLSHNERLRRLYKVGYRANLKYVLRFVSVLVRDAKRLGYRVVVTSDHGELLDGVYDPLAATRIIFKQGARRRLLTIPLYLAGIWRLAGHPCNYHHPDLVTVPWAEL